MVNQQLIDYIKSVRSQGYKDNQIKEHLINHGYSKDLVEESFLLLKTKDFKPKPQKIKKLKKNNWLILLILPVLILIGIIGFFIFQSNRYIGCEDVSVIVHQINDEDVLCVFPDNSKVMTIVKNNGEKTIQNLIFKIKGVGTTIKKLENVNIQPGDISTHTID
jgi:hypothetical protein